MIFRKVDLQKEGLPFHITFSIRSVIIYGDEAYNPFTSTANLEFFTTKHHVSGRRCFCIGKEIFILAFQVILPKKPSAGLYAASLMKAVLRTIHYILRENFSRCRNLQKPLILLSKQPHRNTAKISGSNTSKLLHKQSERNNIEFKRINVLKQYPKCLRTGSFTS